VSAPRIATLVYDGKLRPTEGIRIAALASPLVVVTHRAFADLARELGSDDAAARWLSALACEIDKPIGVNVPTGADGSSATAFVPPTGWTAERLAGWVAGQHDELEAAFGPARSVETVGAGR